MKSLVVVLTMGVLLLCCASPMRADEASKLAKAQELLQLTQGDQMMKMLEPMMKGMTSQMGKDMPADQLAKASEMQEKILALVTASITKVKPAMAKVYTDVYTEEEIDGILAFYKSAVGRAFIQKMPEVMQRLMPVMMQMMGDMQEQIKSMSEGMKEKSK